jgi:hypothetical protein
MFNGPTTITGAVTTGTGGLTIDGTGAVTLSAAPTLTTGLTVNNTAGVTIPSADLPAGQVIDASSGKVIFGTAVNSATIVGGTLTSAANGLAAVAAGGVIGLASNSTSQPAFELAANGSVTFAGGGKLTAGLVELSGGTFTNGAAALTLQSGGTDATATLTGTALTKLTLGGGAAINIPAVVTGGFTLDGVIVDLSEAGAINIVENGVLNLGTSTGGAIHVGGIITKYAATENVVMAGGAGTGAISTGDNVTAFDSKVDYDAIVTQISTGIGIQGTITAAASANNGIDKNDTFAAGVSPVLNVTSVN